MSWRAVATVDEVQPGRPKIVEVDGKQIGVFHEAGAYYAVLNFCPHAGAPVCRGRVSGAVICDDRGRLGYDHARRVLRCPWHHWEFDLATGQSLTPIRQRLKTYPVQVHGGQVRIDVG